MADIRALLSFVLIALGGWLLNLLALPAAEVLKVWLRHEHRMYAGDSTKNRHPPRQSSP
jgi:hypothetical protein